MQYINFKIGGQAGYGIMVTGKMFAKTCMRQGWSVFCYTEYPSLIHGGHNTYQVYANKESAHSQKADIQTLIALDEVTIKENTRELIHGGIIIYDSSHVTLKEKRGDVEYIDLPMIEISKEICGSELMKDTIALGAALALYQAHFPVLEQVIKNTFHGKAEEMIKQNIEAAKRGYEYVTQKDNSKFFDIKLNKIEGVNNRILITGNEAIGLGALAAGCKFYAAYPMTPATAILHFLAANEREYDLVVKQAEDEISVINMAIGASFAGVRSMCATSGGGFALMNETLGFAAISEIPLVIVEAQRTGPATGLPTWSGQAELLYAIHASHGEFLRVVIAPGDVKESYEATIHAFNLADKYQLPVILLTDKYNVESPCSVEEFDAENVKIDRGMLMTQKELDSIKDFKRYEITKTGISPRSIPGQRNGIYQANSDEHDEYGYSTENADMRNKMMEKRYIKLEALKKELPEPKIYGNKNANKTILCWGSTKLTVLEALKELDDVRVIHIQYIFPFPSEFIKKSIDPKSTIIIEGNQTAQLQQLIRQQTGIYIKKTLLKYDGRPFYPEEIIKALK